jgi:hypothetical protein
MANYSFADPGDAIANGAVINAGNFTQMYPDTPIMVGKTLTINGGNFTNVRKDPAWTINGGNWTQISRCSHLNPKFIEKGLTECAIDCEHLISTDEIIVNGVLIETVYNYEDGVNQ